MICDDFLASLAWSMAVVMKIRMANSPDARRLERLSNFGSLCYDIFAEMNWTFSLLFCHQDKRSVIGVLEN